MKTIALIGAVGVGKTHYGKMITEEIENCIFIEEDVTKNIYLSDFYEDMKKWGFHSRISILSMLLENLSSISTNEDFVIMDRCLNELIVFATKEFDESNITEKEFQLYCQLYNSLCKLLPEPDLYIYFFCSPENSYNRIKKRGRDCEKGISLEFCEDILKRYNLWVKTIPEYKIISINTDKEVDLNKLIKEIYSKL